MLNLSLKFHAKNPVTVKNRRGKKSLSDKCNKFNRKTFFQPLFFNAIRYSPIFCACWIQYFLKYYLFAWMLQEGQFYVLTASIIHIFYVRQRRKRKYSTNKAVKIKNIKLKTVCFFNTCGLNFCHFSWCFQLTKIVKMVKN